MKKVLNEEQLEELSFINEWCSFIFNFMFLKYGNTQSLDMYRKVLSDHYMKQNIRGLRHIFTETNGWVHAMRPSEIEELNHLLKEEFDKNLLTYSNKELLKVEEVISRGIINNEKEYRILSNYVDQTFSDESQLKQVNIINGLLENYHIKK